VAGEVFFGTKLLPLHVSSAASTNISALLLLRSDSLDDAATTTSMTTTISSSFSFRSVSHNSSYVTRSTSSKSASLEHAEQQLDDGEM
jgi:hypothetical protein